jgi:hypothetical protein
MRHGAPLVCSFPACRDKGVKFLYCAYCKDACAKRQFRDRHKHGSDDDSVPMRSCPASSATASSSSTGGGDRSLVCGSAAQPTVVSERATISSSDASSIHPRVMKRKRQAMSGPPLDIANGRINDSARSKCGENGTTAGGNDDASDDFSMQKKIRSMQQEGRMEAWTSLLVSRPDDKNDDAMASWLMKVMAVSDPSRPIKEVLGCAKLDGPRLTVELTDNGGPSGSLDDPVGRVTGAPNSSSTEVEDSNNDSSLSSGKRSSCTGDDGNRRNMQDGSSNASSEDLSSENQEASNDDEQDSPSSSSPTENDSSDEDNQDDAKHPTRNREESKIPG